MVGPQVALHIVNIGMFGTALFLYGLMAWQVQYCDCMYVIRRAVQLTCFFAIGLCALFVALQVHWIFTDKNAAVGDMTSMLWMVFDYLLSVFMLSVVATIKIYCDWLNMRRQWARSRRSNEKHAQNDAEK